MRNALALITLQLATLLWIVALMVDPSPLETVPVLVTGLGLLVMSTVATVGSIVVGGRWSHRLGLVVLGFTAAIGVARPIDFLWFVAVAASALAIVSLLSPAVMGSIRSLPSASGPPPRAIAPPLILLATPVPLGLLGNGARPWALLVVALSAPGVAFLFSRALPGGLMALRLLWPVLAVAVAPWLGWWAGSVAVASAIAVAWLSWHQSVKASYRPPREVGTTFPIPPELAPAEVLDAAEIDERGRPR